MVFAHGPTLVRRQRCKGYISSMLYLVRSVHLMYVTEAQALLKYEQKILKRWGSDVDERVFLSLLISLVEV
jgi:hypothetical protein